MKRKSIWIYVCLWLAVLIVTNLMFYCGDPTSFIVMEVRLPRFVMVGLVGASLALSGFLLQILTQNVLADPGILGINQGAGVLVSVTYLFLPLSQGNFQWQIPLCSFIGGILAVSILGWLSIDRQFGMQKMVLNGIGINALGAGLTTVIIAQAHDSLKIEFMVKWMSGSLWSYDWTSIICVASVLVFVVGVLWYFKPYLDYFILLDASQQLLGFERRKYQALFLGLSVLLASIAVAFAGSIAFVGLIAPHLARQLFKNRYSQHVGSVMLLGMLLLWVADLILQYAFATFSIPLGSLVAILSAPYFIYLLVKC